MIVKKKSSGVRKQRARLSIRKGGQLGRRILRTERVRNRPYGPVTTRAIARSAWVFTGGVLRGCYGGVTGVLRGLWPLWSAATTGQRPLRVSGHYGSAATTGRRSLRVSGHYGSAVTTGQRPLRKARFSRPLLAIPYCLFPALWAHGMRPDEGASKASPVTGSSGFPNGFRGPRRPCS